MDITHQSFHRGSPEVTPAQRERCAPPYRFEKKSKKTAEEGEGQRSQLTPPSVHPGHRVLCQEILKDKTRSSSWFPQNRQRRTDGSVRPLTRQHVWHRLQEITGSLTDSQNPNQTFHSLKRMKPFSILSESQKCHTKLKQNHELGHEETFLSFLR